MKYNKLTLFLLFLLILVSCSSSDTEDPIKGKITLVTDWNKRSTGIDQPTNYSVIINNQTLTYTQTSNILPELEAGIYPVCIYNSADKISISGTTVTIVSSNNIVEPNPGWLFTAMTEAQYADNKEETIKVAMQQQVRQLTIELKPEGGTIDRITSITATLSGVTGVWDFKDNKPTGSAMSIPLNFNKQADGTWQAVVRLLGIIGTQQKLIGKVIFENNSSQEILLESDLSSDLSGFNVDKEKALSLNGHMKNTPTEIGVVSNVTDWTRVDNAVVAE